MWSNIYFTSLIIAAIAGAVSIISGYIQHKNDSESLINTQKAVAVANKRAKEIEKENIKLRSGLASLEKEATDSKSKYLEILERFSPRALSEEQKQKFVAFMSDKTKGKVEIRLQNDPESYAFAQEIEQMLKESGCETNLEIILIPGSFRGLRFSVKSESEPPSHAGVLQHAFKEIGYFIEAQVDGKLEPDQLFLFVGYKPE